MPEENGRTVKYITRNMSPASKGSGTPRNSTSLYNPGYTAHSASVPGIRRPTKSELKSDLYNYGTDYSYLSEAINYMHMNLNLPNPIEGNDTVQKAFRQSFRYYNRFKIPNPNTILTKSFPHVFFVRPSCNILSNNGTQLCSSVQNNENFIYAWQSTPELLKELVKSNGNNNDFMMTLSNAAGSFSLNDDYINANTYGQTFTGYKIYYGKNNIDSKTAGEFVINYDDDRNLHIYHLHKLWCEYINGVYRGEFAPANEAIYNKILDYTSAVYYILTAEDGETILFWSKYYGVFPTTIPSNQYSWAKGNVISSPSIEIRYVYSFKEDFNPFTLTEFNYNANIDGLSSLNYEPTYNDTLGHSGRTWVGTPYIELCRIPTNENPYQFKLRFTHP